MGYHIPKGSLIIGNAWCVEPRALDLSIPEMTHVAICRAMSRDEERYPEPELFKPERFLTPDGKLNPNAHDPFDFVFGFGRRYARSVLVWIIMEPDSVQLGNVSAFILLSRRCG